jgi:GrpB-like predicted nucleotidyltransferase (UPF0157 family)
MHDESHGSEWFAEEGGEPVELVRSDPSWPRRFDHIRRQLADALGPAALRIDHIGSTAVPGLDAKPVIDVQVSVARLDAEDEYRSQIESLGWELRAREPEHRFFRPAAGEPRTVHVHVCQAGSTWERAHLLFRDYLHAHPARAAEYVALKRQLASSLGRDRAAYTRSKNPFIAETLQLAAPWAQEVGWRP